ncbi:hypothetical protein SteCoe_21762 [Stentor coeruleus]|uniref:Peroxisomal membrane protein MPV17 n=1 Tax=Stentor coeruleus TaxID=5963 RepID=A0A1R2BNT2_9CILI|nr:hypothetical protein SteCoe_21762 [Stentor coeruleus]
MVTLRKLWTIYISYLNQYPLRTQVASGCFIGFIGDYIAQHVVEQKSYDKKRGLVVSSYGGFEVGIEAKIWLPLLDRLFGSQMTKISALKKLSCEQLIYVPLELAFFMMWTNKLEHQPEKISEKFSRDYWLALGSSFSYWLPVSFLNFYLVPLQYRALYVSITTLIIDIFNSFASHNNLSKSFKKYIDYFKK